MEETNRLNKSQINPENQLFLKNKSSNQGKIETLTFINMMTKIEMKFQTLQGLLFWYSILEIFNFLFSMILFISSSKNMKKIWFFLPHIPKAIIGFFILKKLPKTHEILNKITIGEDLNKLEEDIKITFIEYMKSKKGSIKKLLGFYFLLNTICITFDCVLFCVIAPDFGERGKEEKFFMLILFDLIFIFIDFIYFSFFSSFKYTFAKKENEAIKRALIGFFSQLREGIATGFNKIAKKITRTSSSQNNTERNNDNNNNPFDNKNNNINNNIIKENTENNKFDNV